MKKCIMLICLILTMFVSVNAVSASAFAAELNEAQTADDSFEIVSESHPGMTFLIRFGSASLRKYSGTDTEVAIPSEVEGYTVKTIYTYAFYKSNIESVTVPDTVITIRQGAFMDCTSLREVSLPDSVEYIESQVFEGCASLESITIPDSVVNIGGGCFANCTNLKEIDLGEGLVHLGDAFSGCSSLTRIHIPASVTQIDSYAFQMCDSFSEYTVDEGNQVYAAADGVLYSKDMSKLISYPQAKTGYVFTVPEGVSAIGTRAFYRAYGLTGVELPSTLNSIGDLAFEMCVYLTDIEIPDTVENVGYRTLRDTGWFYEQPYGVLYTGSSVYGYKGTLPERVEIKDGTRRILTGAFTDNSYHLFVDNRFIDVMQNPNTMHYLDLPDSLISIGTEAFFITALKELVIPDSVTEIGYRAFYQNSLLTEVTIGDGVQTIGASAFALCRNLEKLTVGSSLTHVGDYAFSSLYALKELELKYGITTISNRMFGDCYSLTKVKIPASVKSIGYGAFDNCESLIDIEFPDTDIDIGSLAFSETAWYDSQPDGVVYAGRNAYAIKGDIPEDIVLKNGTTRVSWGWLFLQSGYKSITFPEGYAYMKNLSAKLDDIGYAVIPSGVTEIAKNALQDAHLLKPTIYGYINSAAQNYAEENDCPFIAVGTLEHDEDTGVEIGLRNGESLSVSDVEAELLPERLPHGGELLRAYDISLTKDGAAVDLDGYTSVKLPCEDENAKVYRIAPGGAVKDMRAVYHNGFLVFATDRAGIYISASLPDEESYHLGDADNSGEVDAVDASYVQRWCVSLPLPDEGSIMQGDVDLSGEADILDATFIQRAAVMLRTPYDIGALM